MILLSKLKLKVNNLILKIIFLNFGNVMFVDIV